MQIIIQPAWQPTEDVRLLIEGLEDELARHYTAEQRHGLAFAALFQPHIRFFVARLNGQPAGCGGVALFHDFAEVKRMFVRPAWRGRGVAQALLQRVEGLARGAGLAWLRLETGIHQPAAVRLYERAGFKPRAAFGDYLALPPEAIVTSLFFEKKLLAV